jgi:hypothetical protein
MGKVSRLRRACGPSQQWRDPIFDERHGDVPPPLVERLTRMAEETIAGGTGRHLYYERLHALLALASISRMTDARGFDVEGSPSDAEQRLGSAIGQAFHQGCTLADVSLASDLEPERVLAIGKRTIRGTKWLDRL